MKSIKSNIVFIISLIFLALIALNPKAKAFLLSGLIKTGLYQPGVTRLSSKGATKERYPIVPAVLLISSRGEQVDLPAIKNKVIFINFWATWCPPCIAEMPSINSLKAKFNYNDQVIFMMVDVDNKINAANAFMQKNKYNLPVYTQGSIIPESLFKGSIPTTVIINKKSEIVFHHEGMADYNSKKMQNFINDLLK